MVHYFWSKCYSTPVSCLFIFLSFKKYLCIYLFIWLHHVWVATVCGICSCGMRDLFSCSMQTLSCSIQDLVPWPGIEPGPPALGAWSLNHWTAREVPLASLIGREKEGEEEMSFLSFSHSSEVHLLVHSLMLWCNTRSLSHHERRSDACVGQRNMKHKDPAPPSSHSYINYEVERVTILESSQKHLPEAEMMGQSRGEGNPFSELDSALWSLHSKQTDLLAISRAPITLLPQGLCTHCSLSIMLFLKTPTWLTLTYFRSSFQLYLPWPPKSKTVTPHNTACLHSLPHFSEQHLSPLDMLYIFLIVVSPLTF